MNHNSISNKNCLTVAAFTFCLCFVIVQTKYKNTIKAIKIFRMLNHYLDPRCKNPKKSQTFDARATYVLEPTPLCNKRTIFSTNLYAANKTPAPCNKKRGAKRTGNEIFLAPDGVPWKKEKRKKGNINEHNLKIFQIY